MLTTGSATPIGTIDQFGRSEQANVGQPLTIITSLYFFGNSRKTLYVTMTHQMGQLLIYTVTP